MTWKPSRQRERGAPAPSASRIAAEAPLAGGRSVAERWFPRLTTRRQMLLGLAVLVCVLTLVSSVLMRAQRDMAEAADIVRISQIADDLALATRNLAFERGRTNAALSAPRPVSAANRAFIDDRRAIGTTALERAKARVAEVSSGGVATDAVLRAIDGLRANDRKVDGLRQRVDLALTESSAERDPDLVSQWFPAMTDLLQSIVGTMWALDAATQTSTFDYYVLTRLRYAALVFRLEAGEESALLAAAVASGQPFSAERIAQINLSRGRTTYLRGELLRLASTSHNERVTKAIGEAMERDTGAFRELRDRVYAAGVSDGAYPMNSDDYGAQSVIALDSITGIVDSAGQVATEQAQLAFAQAQIVFYQHLALFLAALLTGGILALGIARTNTERRAMESRLRESQKLEALGKLTGGMAHDFNNFLGVIIGNLDMVRDIPDGDAKRPQYVNAAVSSAERAAELTRSLLAFSRRQPLNPQATDLNQRLLAIANLLRHTLGEDIVLTTEFAADAWPVRVDAAQLDSCIVNLANNARDAMPNGGALSIVTRNVHLGADFAQTDEDLTPGDYVLIEVADSGSGMSPEVAARVFEPFFTTKAAGHGTGLGLSMVFGFVKQSGGLTQVDSLVGRGTVMRIYLPRAAGQARSGVDLRDVIPRAGEESILVVEDNEEMRRAVVAQLGSLGYRVIEAPNGAAALHLLERAPVLPDLLFSDIVMPGKPDGYELARIALERWPGLRVLLTSGFPGDPAQRQGSMPLRLRLLGKPYRQDDLARAVRAALDAELPPVAQMA